MDKARAWVVANIDTLTIIIGKCPKCNRLVHHRTDRTEATAAELEGVVPGTNYTTDVLVRYQCGTLVGIQVVDTHYTNYKKMFQCKQAGILMYEVTMAEIQGAIEAVSKVLRTTTTTSVVCKECVDREQEENKTIKTKAAEETETIEDLREMVIFLENMVIEKMAECTQLVEELQANIAEKND
jgi:hypothetical protein